MIPTMSTNALGDGSYVGFFTSIRYQLLCGLDRALADHFDAVKVALIILAQQWDGKAVDATSSTMVFVSLEAGKTFGMEVIRYFNYCSRALSVLCSWEFFVGSVLWKWGTVLHSNLPISQVEENRYFGWVEDGVHQLVKSIGFWSFGGQNRWHLNALNHKSLKHLIDNWRLPHIRA